MRVCLSVFVSVLNRKTFYDKNILSKFSKIIFIHEKTSTKR